MQLKNTKVLLFFVFSFSFFFFAVCLIQSYGAQVMWDKNYVVMIENAYFACKPPTQAAAAPKKVRPILHEYIRKSLFVDLNPFTTEQILKRLRYAALTQAFGMELSR
jgi:hypothetical protein